MVPEFFIPEPIAFNCFKHHRNSILWSLNNEPLENLKQKIVALNHNYIDIYTGNLSPAEICTEVINFIKSSKFDSAGIFESWVATKGGFRILRLSDQSLWVLRACSDPVRFVHIHPSKTGNFSARVKGSTLKIFYLIKRSNTGEFSSLTTDKINSIRKEAGLSPIKRWEPGQGFHKALKLFE